MKRLAIPTVLLGLSVLCSEPLVAQASVVLQPGDAITLRIWPDEPQTPYSGQYFIGADGRLALPFIGEIQAAGVPVDQLEESIRQGYQGARREIVVSIAPQFFVGVTGAVRNPSVYAVGPTQNLFDVVAMAGGFSPESDQEQVRIVRENGQVVPVNALATLQTGVDINRYRLQSGDQIIVPARGGIDVRTVFEVVRTISTLVLVIDRLANTTN